MTLVRRGNTYWFDFKKDGRRYRGSCDTDDKDVARKIESAAKDKVALGKWDIDVAVQSNVTLKEAFDLLEVDFRERNKWSVRQESNFRCARAAFPETTQARALTSADFLRYIQKRKREKLAAASINRLTLIISQALKLAGVKVPKFPYLDESKNVRHGFLDRVQFDNLAKHLPADLSDFCLFCFVTSWRRGEVSKLTWGHIEDGEVRLRAEDTKNGHARSVPIAGELAQIIERRRKARHSKFDKTDEPIFHRGDGKPILEFRKTWTSACKKAGLKGRLVHDLRRSGVRNMIRSGTPLSVAMSISGHKTFSMFKRYDISDTRDKQQAMESVWKYNQAAQQKVQSIA